MCAFCNVGLCLFVGFVMCGCVLVICLLVFTAFCIFMLCFSYCFVHVYLFLFVFSILLYGILPSSDNSIAVNNNNNNKLF